MVLYEYGPSIDLDIIYDDQAKDHKMQLLCHAISQLQCIFNLNEFKEQIDFNSDIYLIRDINEYIFYSKYTRHLIFSVNKQGDYTYRINTYLSTEIDKLDFFLDLALENAEKYGRKK